MIIAGDILADSSRTEILQRSLSYLRAPVVRDLNRWFAGVWSTRESLTEFAWRMEIGPSAIAAALWLYDAGEARMNNAAEAS